MPTNPIQLLRIFLILTYLLVWSVMGQTPALPSTDFQEWSDFFPGQSLDSEKLKQYSWEILKKEPLRSLLVSD